MRKICIHIQVANLGIYIYICTQMHIYYLCACVYITCIYIYAFLRGVREVVRRERNLHFDLQLLRFSGNSYIVDEKNLPKF